MKNIPALDGLRGLSIALVLIFHWFPSSHWVNILPNGPIGVTLFFVLSGFLITQILLNKKEQFNFAENIKNFLARRALRIFPIYYLVLCTIALLFHKHIALGTDFYQHPIPYFFYFYNHFLETTQNWSDQLSPYWSLAVEEQFYLFWPFLILLIPTKKKLIWAILSTIIMGIVARYYFIYVSKGIGVYMVTCIDCFAWGALLAYFRKENIPYTRFLKIIFTPILLFWIWICLKTTDQDLTKVLLFRSTTSMVGLGLIHFALNRNFFSKFMGYAPLRFLGKISYGVYLYHMVVPQLFFIFLAKLHIGIPENWTHITSAIVLLLFSTLSYYFLEQPILQLKKHFE